MHIYRLFCSVEYMHMVFSICLPQAQSGPENITFSISIIQSIDVYCLLLVPTTTRERFLVVKALLALGDRVLRVHMHQSELVRAS